MNFLKYFILCIFLFCLLFIFVMAARQRKLFKYILTNAFFGIVTFLIIYFLKDLIGVKLALNWYTLLGSSVLGVPAVIGYLVLHLMI